MHFGIYSSVTLEDPRHPSHLVSPPSLFQVTVDNDFYYYRWVLVVLVLHINGILFFFLHLIFFCSVTSFWDSAILLQVLVLVLFIAEDILLRNIADEYSKICKHVRVGELLSCLQFVALMNNVAMCTFVSRSLSRHICISLETIHRCRIVIRIAEWLFFYVAAIVVNMLWCLIVVLPNLYFPSD